MNETLVKDLQIGDQIIWCDRVVQIARLDCPRPTRHQRRTKIDITVTGDDRPLHYFADEYVTLA